MKYAQHYQLDLVCAGINRVSNEYKKISSDYSILEKIQKDKTMSGIEILKQLDSDYFHSVVNVLIDFSFLKEIKLRFIEKAIYEDHHFGSILFLKAKRIMILEYYFYNQVSSLNSTTRPKEITQSRILLDFQSWKTTIERMEQDIQMPEERQIIQRYIKNFYFPMLCGSYLKLDSSTQQDFKKDMREKNRYYGSLKTFLMLDFQKIFFLLKRVKSFFRG